MRNIYILRQTLFYKNYDGIICQFDDYRQAPMAFGNLKAAINQAEREVRLAQQTRTDLELITRNCDNPRMNTIQREYILEDRTGNPETIWCIFKLNVYTI